VMLSLKARPTQADETTPTLFAEDEMLGGLCRAEGRLSQIDMQLVDIIRLFGSQVALAASAKPRRLTSVHDRGSLPSFSTPVRGYAGSCNFLRFRLKKPSQIGRPVSPGCLQ